MHIIKQIGNSIRISDFRHGGGDRDRDRTPESDKPLQRRASAGDDFDQVIVSQHR